MALLLVSVLVGLGAGMPLEKIIDSISSGMGGTLGTIAVIVGLGAMFGKMLEVSGGAEVLAHAFLNRFGADNSRWTLGLVGFLVAIPVFFDVGLVILAPVVYGLTAKSKKPMIFFALPLLAGLAATHAFIPPTPGPIAVAGILNAPLSWVILYGSIAAICATAVAGPIYGRLIAKKVSGQYEKEVLPDASSNPVLPKAQPPSIGIILLLIGLPLGFILCGSAAAAWLPNGAIQHAIVFTGHPFIALLLSTMLSFQLLGRSRGLSKDTIQQLSTAALEPAGIIILVTGAGGVFKQVLIDSKVGDILTQAMHAASFTPIVAGFIAAAVMRLLQGSATVAMLSAAGLMAAVVEQSHLSPQHNALLVISIASGATTTSHVNDSGFWLVSRYFGLSVPDTLKTWTVSTTLIALVGLITAVLLSLQV